MITSDQKRAQKRFYGFVKEQKCLGCGVFPTSGNPIEAAHVKLVVSGKTGRLLPRSHSGEAAWGCVPLCRSCHLTQHEVGEDAFFEGNSPVPVAASWGSLLLRFFTEEASPF